jgi:hypothetical protein
VQDPSRTVVALAILASVVACSAGCESTSKPTASPTSAVIASPASVPTVIADPNALATQAAESPAARLSSALFVESDFPADMSVRQNQTKVLSPNDVPGLNTSASGQFATVVSQDKNEFVNEIAVVPDASDPQALLDAFNLSNYLAGFTGGAKDATGAALTPTAAPFGSKAYSYSGSVSAAGQLQQVEGQSVAFVHGSVFVVVIHGRYTPSSRAIDVAALATNIDKRLDAITGLN